MTATITLKLNDTQAEARFEALIRKVGELEAAAGRAQKQLNGPGWGNISQTITAMSTGFLAVSAAMKKSFEVGRQVADVINELGERGNPGARELVQSFSALRSEMETLAGNPEVVAMFQMMSQGVTEGLLPALQKIPGAVREMEQAWVQFQMKQAGATQFMLDNVAKLQAAAMKAAEAALKDQRERAEVQRQINLVTQDELAIRTKLAAEIRRDELAKVKDSESLVEMREKELAKQKELAKEGKLTDEARKKSLNEINLIEERRVELNREIAAAAMKEVEARKKWFDTVKGQTKELQGAFGEVWSKMATEAEQNLAKVLAKQKAAVDTLSKKIQDLRGGADGSQDMLQSIRGKLDPRATLRQIAEDRARKAVQDVAGAGGDEREQRRAAVKARETAFRQARAGGRFNDVEVATAQKELTQGVIDGAVQSGKLSETQAKALRQAAETVGQVAENQAQMQENIEQIERVMQEQLNLANAVNRRQRAQRSGG